MSVILFGAIPTEKIAVAVLALVTAALLFNIKKYFARQSPPRKRHINYGEEGKHWTAREIAQKNAQTRQESATFTGGHKPESIAQWEVEFFELTRQMTAQIDTKMSALSTLSVDAAKICQRMETLLERLEKAIQAPINPTNQVNQATTATRPDFPPVSLPDSTFSPTPFETTLEKKTLFPRLSSLSGLEFSDYDDLTALGADLFADAPLGAKTYDRPLRDWPSPQPAPPPQEFKPQYPNSAELPQDRTLGELLLQEKQTQAAKRQPVPKAPTLQPAQIESIFKPVEPRPIGSRPLSQVIPRERVGS